VKSETKNSKLNIQRKKIFLNGFLIWTFWIIFYAIIFKFQIGVSWAAALISSAGNYYVYALLSISIWFICKHIPFGYFRLPVLFFIHFFLSIVFSAGWMFFSYGLWYLQAGDAIFTVVGIRTIIGWQFLFGVIIYLLIAGIFYTMIYYRQFRKKELKEAELKLLTRDAELKALKMQINPHFLFNSLNSINALVTSSPQQAREMLVRLSDLLRLTLENRDQMLVTLKKELDLAHLYLEIESFRFGDRLEVLDDIDATLLETPFPAMTLQPLLENAVKHGISSRRGKGTIRMTIKREDGNLCCSVSNTVGNDNRTKFKTAANGTGLENITQRLNLLYNDLYSFNIDTSIPNEFTISLKLPIKSNGKD